jgi:hypothetical protein
MTRMRKRRAWEGFCSQSSGRHPGWIVVGRSAHTLTACAMVVLTRTRAVAVGGWMDESDNDGRSSVDSCGSRRRCSVAPVVSL